MKQDTETLTTDEIRLGIRRAAVTFRGYQKTSYELFEWAFGREPSKGETLVTAHQLSRLGCEIFATKKGKNVFSLTGDKLYNR